LSDSNTPISFNWNIHGSHFRQRRQTRCRDDDSQHVLFILDSSGSISPSDFKEMKQAVAKLVPLFCKKIETALINFSSNIRLEYCFDCFKDTLLEDLQQVRPSKEHSTWVSVPTLVPLLDVSVTVSLMALVE